MSDETDVSSASHKGGNMAEGLWLRLWVAAVRSRKVQTLSDATFRWWINFLCLSKMKEGYLPCVDDLAWELRTSPEKVTKAIHALVEKKLVDETSEGFKMHDWNEWQFRSDSSTERTRKHKARERERRGNGAGTFPERPQKQSTETETETETERALDSRPIDDLRDEFWAAYPEKQRTKPGLVTHWYADRVGHCLDPEKLHREIMAGLERAKASEAWAKEGGKFVCSATAFLEHDRWLEAWNPAPPPKPFGVPVVNEPETPLTAAKCRENAEFFLSIGKPEEADRWEREAANCS